MIGPEALTSSTLLGEGVVLTTVSGRKTSPTPRIDLSSDRRAVNTIRRRSDWLRAEAVIEAGRRGRTDLASSWGREDMRRCPPASVESMFSYLFEWRDMVALDEAAAERKPKRLVP